MITRVLRHTVLAGLTLLGAFTLGTAAEWAIFDVWCHGACTADPYVDE